MSEETIKQKAEEKAKKIRATVRARGIAPQPDDDENSNPASSPKPEVKPTPDLEAPSTEN